MAGKIAVFVDGPNLFYSARALGFEIDFKRLLSHVERQGSLVRAFYYTTASEDRDFQGIRPLLDWLNYNGFTLRTKPVKEYDDGEGRRKFKRSMAVELAIDALELAHRIDQVMLFSGDGDYRSLIEALQHLGARVTVVSTLRTQPPMLADELRRQADEFFELDDLRRSIGRESAASATPGNRFAAG